MSSSIDNLAKTLQQAISEKDARKTSSYDGPAVVDSIDGDTIWVRIPGGEDRTPVQRTIDAGEGDNIIIRIANHKAWAIGNSTSPPSGIVANQALANSITANQAISETNEFVMENSRIVNADIQNVKAKNAEIENVAIQNARITNSFIDGLTAEDSEIRRSKIEGFTVIDGVVQGLQADKAEIEGNISANSADIQTIYGKTAFIDALEAQNIKAHDIIADHAEITNLDSNYAHITNGVIDRATIGYEQVNGLDANYAHITNGVIDKATIDYAKVNNLIDHYAAIDLANVNNAWIQSGIIKDGAISNAQIHDVSANKLTAGTIDANKINVANLKASNLIVDRINGQPVFGGYVTVEKSSGGYSEKSPKNEGWYEFTNGSFILSEDTVVNLDKVYYSATDKVSLYDQTYIDGLAQNLNERIDGTIETFTGTVVPTLNNYPANGWYDSTQSPVYDVRAEHVGDVYYVVSDIPGYEYDGFTYRFTSSGTAPNVTYEWVLIKDTQITKALADISDIKTFDDAIWSWKEDTDEELTSIKGRTSTLEGYTIYYYPTTDTEQGYKYTRTTDTAVDPNKTYYEQVDGEYVVVENPVVDDLDIYYERFPKEYYIYQNNQYVIVQNPVAEDFDKYFEKSDIKSELHVTSDTLSEVKQTVDENSTTLRNYSEMSIDTPSGSVTGITNIVNTLKQTIDGNSATIDKFENETIPELDGKLSSDISWLQSQIDQSQDNVLLRVVQQTMNNSYIYVPTEDTAVTDGKVYYTVENPSYIYKKTTAPFDSTKTYYELVDGEYVEVDNPIEEDLDNYYEQYIQGEWSIVREPVDADISTYYERTNDFITDPSQAIATVLLESFINIAPDEIKISSDRVSFPGYANFDEAVSDKVNEATDAIQEDMSGKIDRVSGNSMMTWHNGTLSIEAKGTDNYATVIGGDGIEFVYGYTDLYDENDRPAYKNNVVAMINQDKLDIQKTVVLDEMQMGRSKWAWHYDDSDESIYLKWIGEVR